ncbi:MAG: GFA family protein [Chloroflexi bacterium]|nr:GFA family protein [Chloroflexota bacterium]
MTSETNRRTGGCLCGAVRFEAHIPKNEIHVCHCHMCRKLAGGPGFALACDPDIKITGEALRWYKSSKWAQRGFCGQCGANLFYKLEPEYGEHFNLSATTLDDENGLKIVKHIYVDSQPDYYEFADDAPRLTQEEFLAQFRE